VVSGHIGYAHGEGIVKVQTFSEKDRGLSQIFVCAIFMEGG
jgi:hypothetical protein